MVRSGFLHQVISRGPVAVAVQKRADDPAAQHSGERLLIFLGLKRRNYLIALWKAANMQAFFIRRATTKARVIGRISFLETLSHSFRVGRVGH